MPPDTARPPTLAETLDAAAKARILDEIRKHGGHVPSAAVALGISRRGIYTWIDRLKIRVEAGVEHAETPGNSGHLAKSA